MDGMRNVLGDANVEVELAVAARRHKVRYTSRKRIRICRGKHKKVTFSRIAVPDAAANRRDTPKRGMRVNKDQKVQNKTLHVRGLRLANRVGSRRTGALFGSVAGVVRHDEFSDEIVTSAAHSVTEKDAYRIQCHGRYMVKEGPDGGTDHSKIVR